MNRKIIGVTVGTTMNPRKIIREAQEQAFEELLKLIEENTLKIEKLSARVTRLEGAINTEDSAILGSAKLGTMVLGKGA